MVRRMRQAMNATGQTIKSTQIALAASISALTPHAPKDHDAMCAGDMLVRLL